MIASFPTTAFASISQLFPRLLDATLRSLLVAAAVWVGLRLLRAHNVVTQKTAWGLVLAGALLMPVAAPWAARLPWLPANAMLVLPAQPSWLPMPMSHTDARSEPGASLEMVRKANATPPKNHAVPHFSAPAAIHLDSAGPSASNLQRSDRFPAPTISSSPSPGNAIPAPTMSVSPIRLPSLGTLAWLLYFAVLGGLLFRLFYGIGASAALWQSAQPIDLEPARDLTQGLHLRSTSKLHSPVTVGSGILLPANYREWDAEKLRIVLAHERSHVRQRDFYLQLFAGFYAALFWFSPLGWWLKRKLSDLSEAISDRAGLREAASRASYAQVLLEFAAMPRTTQIGVAMARPGRLTHRIERLLNESSFRQSFAGGRRMLVALLLVPAALFAATALIRVEAAIQAPQPPTPPTAPAVLNTAPVITPATPELSPAPPEPAAQAPIPAVAPATPESMPAPPKPPAAKLAPYVAPQPPEPPEPPSSDEILINPDDGNALILHKGHGVGMGHGSGHQNSYSYSFNNNGESYAIVKGNGHEVQMSGDWPHGHHEALEKAKRMAHGDFLWFTRDGKSYIIEEPEKLAQIESMYKPMEELGRQQEELGRQQEVLGREQEKLGRQQEMASIPTPDLSKVMSNLNAAVEKLQAKKGATMTQEQLAELESKIGELQGKIGSMQGDFGAKMGEFGGLQGKLGEQQGKLGAQQGRLGAEQGRIAVEADKKVKSLIDESLKNGKAKPVD